MRAKYNDIEFRILELNNGSIEAVTNYNQLMLTFDMDRKCIVQCVSYDSMYRHCEHRKNARYKDIPGAIVQPCEPLPNVMGSNWQEEIIYVDIIDDEPVRKCTMDDIHWTVVGKMWEDCENVDSIVNEENEALPIQESESYDNTHEFRQYDDELNPSEITTGNDDENKNEIHNKNTPYVPQWLEQARRVKNKKNEIKNEKRNVIQNENEEKQNEQKQPREGNQLLFWTVSVAIVISFSIGFQHFGHSMIKIDLVADVFGAFLSSIFSGAGIVIAKIYC